MHPNWINAIETSLTFRDRFSPVICKYFIQMRLLEISDKIVNELENESIGLRISNVNVVMVFACLDDRIGGNGGFDVNCF